MVATERILVILNPHSGHAQPKQVRQALAQYDPDGLFDTHELAEGEDIATIIREAIKGRGAATTIVAAGGDGSVSAVAQALVGTEARLGIIPLGTTNVLARELGIPLDLNAACALIAGPNDTTAIDAMKIGDGLYFTQVGVGLDSLMIRETTTANKKRFGPAAYVWSFVRQMAGFQPRRFSLSVDGRTTRPRASQILLANCGTLGTSGLKWGPDVRVDDGHLDVCIIRASHALDYLGVAWDFVRRKHKAGIHVRYLRADRVVAIHSDRPLPVQADGEVVGDTPVEVRVMREALHVIIPPAVG